MLVPSQNHFGTDSASLGETLSTCQAFGLIASVLYTGLLLSEHNLTLALEPTFCALSGLFLLRVASFPPRVSSRWRRLKCPLRASLLDP